MFLKTFRLTFLLALVSLTPLFSQMADAKGLDVLSYDLMLDVDIKKESFIGTVDIDFLVDPNENMVVFDCGNLYITEVTGRNVNGFIKKNKKVVISLDKSDGKKNSIQISYSGQPSYGIFFMPERHEVYTVFSTSQWMVCNDAPNDKAKFKVELSIPKGNLGIASGILKNTMEKGDRIHYSYVQDYEAPSYTYGFAIGPFNKSEYVHRNISMDYYATNYSKAELDTIFRLTSEIIDFFESKSGVPYMQSSYSQILVGNHYQEMSGFAVLKESYGNLVLKDSTETNLISHELAHQWWGNMITCENWNHFWLNEGMATFMSAAFNESKFGKDKYQSDIDSYRNVYESVKKKGKDKPLVFADWSNPTSDDRNLVYFKGAYVMHLLREELGEKEFWNGIKFYTQKYFGRSVNTTDFKVAIEESADVDLNTFFNKWVFN